MSVRDAMLLAANIPYWPAAYASLLTYLDIDRASPTYFSATIQHELESIDNDALLRRWEGMTRSERLYVAACVISDEVAAFADMWCNSDADEAEPDMAAAGRRS